MASSHKSFELWFPFTPGVIGVAEDEIATVHNRPFGEILTSIVEAGDWRCEQCYLTNQTKSFARTSGTGYRFFPVSFRWRSSSRLYARQWSLAACRKMILRPPDVAAIFSAYGLFTKSLALLSRMRGTPYIVIIGGWYNRMSRSQRSYFDHAFRVLVHTEMQKQELVRVGYRGDNIEVFPLGIDTSRFEAKSEARYAWGENSPRLLYVGRLQESKGPMEALLAFEAVRHRFPKASLQIVGPCNDIPFRQRMIDYVESHSLQDAVSFTGPVPYEELPRYYQQADLFLFPSPYEGLPSVVLESMACGTPPVVVRGSGGTEEAVVDGESGWVVDTPRLAYELVQLLNDAAEIRRRGINGAQRIQELYSAQRTYDILSSLLSQLALPRGNMKLISRLEEARH
jgi:glycosyltransferase involved in cell wall biosynthesis